MDVDVDEARRYREAARIDDAGGIHRTEAIHCRDAAILDADVEALGRGAGAVDDIAILDDYIEIHRLRLELFASRLSQQLPRHAGAAGEQSPVHPEHDAGDPGRLFRGQEHGSVGDIVRLPDPTERVPLDEALEDHRIAIDALLPDGRPDRAWSDGVAPDPVRPVS